MQNVAGEHGPTPRQLGVVHQHPEDVEVTAAEAVLGRGIGVLAGQLRQVAQRDALFSLDHLG